jgi:hypothetical protein
MMRHLYRVHPRRLGRLAMPFGVLVGLVSALFTGGCGFPFGSCERDYIEATLPATLSGTTPSAPLLSNRIAETNLDPATFDDVRRIVRGDDSAPVALVFTLEAFDSPVRVVLAMIVATPMQVGDTLDARGVFHGGGWGVAERPLGSDAVMDLIVGDAEATGAIGTLVVASRAPLRLEVDIAFEGLGTSAVRLQGELDFRTVTESVDCS